MALTNLATLFARRGEPDRAARIFGAAEAVREAIGSRLGLPERTVYESAVAAARTALGETAFIAAWDAGRALTIEQAASEALESLALPESASVDAGRRPGIDLTPRELDVLRLVARGLTDKEIGEALFISWRTAQGHVASILAKLDVTTRAAAAGAAFRSGLISAEDPSPA